VFTADFVSHLVVHALMPTRRELRHMLRVSLGAFGAVILPMVFIGLAGAEVWTLAQALRASTIALLVTLGAIGFLAVRRVRMSAGKKLMVLVAEVALGVLVVSLELLVH
jgi:hypothetical protein